MTDEQCPTWIFGVRKLRGCFEWRPSLAKRLECVELVPAFEPHSRATGPASRTHSKRFARLCCALCVSAVNAWFNLGIIACVIGSLAASSSFAAEGTGEDWPRFLGPSGNGISGETGLLDKWPTNGPPLLWEKSIGTGYGAP